MSHEIELKDGALDLTIETKMELGASSRIFENILHALNMLHARIDMAHYEGNRIGDTDSWGFLGTTQAGRHYTATASYVSEVVTYSNVSFDEGTPEEVRMFMDVLDLLGQMLLSTQLEFIRVSWS